MLFCEPSFLFLFLPVLLVVYYAVPARARNLVLAGASLAFYAVSESRFLGWLVASVAVNYWIARGIEARRGSRWARRLLIIGIASDLSLLLVFKYAGLTVDAVNRGLSVAHLPAVPAPHLLLPLGISFFTFHKISYKVDVYRGTAQAKRGMVDLALYILLFPQLIAGPIVRYYEIAAELVQRKLSVADFAEGIRRFILGLGKKMIVANTVAYTADRIFALPAAEITSGLACLAVLCYTLQIYYDFSGYSDMAIGLARMFGFHFPENFDYPYVSASITEFWRRWHMSLSRWFRDYLYIPLGGNRVTPARTYLNLVTVFFLCGLWHGASYHFVVWGMFHGALLVAERLGRGRLLAQLPTAIGRTYAMLAVMFGWVLFRADGLQQAGVFFAAMVGLTRGHSPNYPVALYLDTELLVTLLVGVVGALGFWPYVSKCLACHDGRAPRTACARLVAWGELLALCCVLGYSLLLIAARTYNPFIYFRF